MFRLLSGRRNLLPNHASCRCNACVLITDINLSTSSSIIHGLRTSCLSHFVIILRHIINSYRYSFWDLRKSRRWFVCKFFTGIENKLHFERILFEFISSRYVTSISRFSSSSYLTDHACLLESAVQRDIEQRRAYIQPYHCYPLID